MNTCPPDKPTTTIRQTDGLWFINVDYGNLHYARTAWTEERARQIAADLVQLAETTANTPPLRASQNRTLEP